MNVYHPCVWSTTGRGLVITLNNNWTTLDIRAPVSLRIFSLDIKAEFA